MKRQLQLVNFNQAKRLKEIGFDWFTDDFYIKGVVYHRPEYISKIGKPLSNGSQKFTDWNNWDATEGIRFSAPTIQLALKYIRDEKKINCCVCFGYGKYYYDYNGADKENCKFYDTYGEAESVLLDKLLTIIEEQNEK